MKNTPKVGLVSNFWGAVQFAGGFLDKLGMTGSVSEPGRLDLRIEVRVYAS